LTDKLLRITGGLPQKIRMLVEVLPEDIDFLVRARLVELNAGSLAVLQLAQLFGRPIAPGALAVLAKVPRSDIEELVMQGFLALDNSGAAARLTVAESYQPHPMLVVADKKTRQKMHGACAAHLQTLQSMDLDESLHEPITMHLLGADRVDQAASHALQAGRWLAKNAALHRSESILTHILDASPSQTQELRLALVDTHVALGQFDRAIELCRGLSSEEEQGIQLRLARIHSLGGDLEAAQKALEILWNQPSMSQAQRELVGVELADVLLRRGDLDKATELCLDALPNSSSDYALAFNHVLGKVAFWRGQWDEAHARYEQVLSDLTQSNAMVDRGDVLHNIGLVSLRQGRYSKACEQIQNGL
ncbi:MAG TPA: tetratricopeptide repeat protein, partial [Myxococcales bacterium]|nr:tetratricopeptide repeat protein [Myxococcales bacterium]